jgi:hypothetical protein
MCNGNPCNILVSKRHNHRLVSSNLASGTCKHQERHERSKSHNFLSRSNLVNIKRRCPEINGSFVGPDKSC